MSPYIVNRVRENGIARRECGCRFFEEKGGVVGEFSIFAESVKTVHIIKVSSGERLSPGVGISGSWGTSASS